MISKNFCVEKGIDIPHFQGEINWSKVKYAGINYGKAKAIEEGTYADPKFLNYWNGMNSNQTNGSNNNVAAAYNRRFS
ncbi:MAG: GH25 family lysozyme [Rickettsiella sp.]|nr:GH25 family lysozyme [Rickettsiella sp.]